MLENDVETYLNYRVDILGGFTRKCKWIGRRGATDRIVFLNGAHFVELKKPGIQKPDDHQIREHNRMKAQGVKVHVLNDKVQVDWFLKEITEENKELSKKLDELKCDRKPCASAMYDTYVVIGWNEAIMAVKKLLKIK